MTRFRLGSRGSPLALVQARAAQAAIAAVQGWDLGDVAIVTVRTTGDRVQDRALAEIGGKALWTKELDRALLAGEVDACVHSLKDVETVRPPSITVAAVLPRADVRDRLVGAPSLTALLPAPVVGTSSPRRRAQVLRARPDAEVVLFRGNVDTRLAKLAAGEAHATLLAAAGLERLGRNDVGTPLDWLPAPAQGAVAIEVRADDEQAAAVVEAVDDAATHACVAAERALLAALGADCHSPVAALATLNGDRLTLSAELLAEDGSASIAGEAYGDGAGGRLAADLLAHAPDTVRRLFHP